MTLTTHTATGILVTQWTNSPFLGFIAAVVSHYCTDAIPHGDEWLYLRHVYNPKDPIALISASVDLFMLCIIVLAVVNYSNPNHLSVILAATMGAILPDVLITLHTRAHHKKKNQPAFVTRMRTLYYSFLDKHLRFHHFFHGIMHTPIRFRTAVLYQIIFVTLFIYTYIGNNPL